MSAPVIIPDNAREKRLTLTDEQWDDLSLIAGHTVKNLCDRDEGGMSLLVFPDSLDLYGDKIGDSTILDIQDRKVSTGNLMGFVGCRGTNLRIRSRFDEGEDDYFMHYLLEKVFSVNLFDLPHSTDAESVFDFVLFLFPFFLKRALSQGLYKEYVTQSHNDDKIRGVLDLSRHIRLNIPFTGNVAYKTREHTADNALMEIVRHTIEYIRTKEFGPGILSRDEETKADVSLVIDATPAYEKRDRERIINKNLRAKIHPYYSEYEPLRRLCIQILRQEEIKYGEDDDTVYGVLFDGSWLWEEYLNTLLGGLGFNHPENKLSRGAIHLFTPRRAPRYPDFYNDHMVLDAKYKRYNECSLTGISREDLAQVISYMYIRKLNTGGFLVPGGSAVTIERETLHGYGGEMFLISLPVAHAVANYDDFRSQMSMHEKQLLEAVSSLQEEVLDNVS
jgi:5-methylcytosine-specific restriction endonuclease McrBC regulatory subunit McrC